MSNPVSSSPKKNTVGTSTETTNTVTASVPTETEYTYAILQETSGEECESWLYFIRYQGNEEALAHLEKQIDEVDWYILDDLSTFDIETKVLVSEKTAKEMSKVDLNAYSFHRKFDGKMKLVNLGFKEHYSNKKKMAKAFDVLGYGQIEDYVSDEDIDPEDLADSDSADSDDILERVSSSDEESDTDSDTESESDSSPSPRQKKKSGKLPAVMTSKPKNEIPRFAKAKKKKNTRSFRP